MANLKEKCIGSGGNNMQLNIVVVVYVEISKFDTLEIPTALSGLISPTC